MESTLSEHCGDIGDHARNVNAEGTPTHVAIIMDGNGRWAQKRNLPRLAGHRAGVENVRPVLREAARLGVQYLTLYAFSTENWTRPPDEVNGLMQLLGEFIGRETEALHRENVRIRHLGSPSQLPSELVRKIQNAVDLTSANSGITVAVALNYGGRQEILEAMRSVIEQGIPASQLMERHVVERLSTAGMPDPDLVIRTSGERRLSNFLIWQTAYAEYWTTPVLWPDFGPRDLLLAISEYGRRDRRFGGVSSNHDPFVSVEQAIAEVRAGRFVLILDDEERENEGDLMIAAERAGANEVNFLATHARGLICLPMLGSRLDELGVPLMTQRRPEPDGPAFTVSVDARHGVTSGISANDRAQTVAAMIDPQTMPEDIVMPGHLFPLRYAEGGVLRRRGHTEASVDLLRLAGMYPAAVICEVMAPDGTMARGSELADFARTHGIRAITIQQIADHRRRLRRKAKPAAVIPTATQGVSHVSKHQDPRELRAARERR